MNWLSKDLGDAVTAQAALIEIEELFHQLLGSEPVPPHAAIFTRHQNIGGLHCHVVAYFPPLTERIGNAWAAEPCPCPRPEGLDLLVGNVDAWKSLFSEHE